MTRRIRHSRNSGGSLWLLPLPGGLGLNIGRGYSGFASVRSWEWARYDHADHIEAGLQERWVSVQLSKGPHGSTPFAVAFDEWQNRRFWRRHGGPDYQRLHPETPLQAALKEFKGARRVRRYIRQEHPRELRRREVAA